MKPTPAATEAHSDSSATTEAAGKKLDELIHLDNQPPPAKDSLLGGLDADLINQNSMEGASQNNTPLLGFEDNKASMKQQDNLKGWLVA